MNKEELQRRFDELAEYVEYAYRRGLTTDLTEIDQLKLRQSAASLTEGLYLLLPPRGKASSHEIDCPHCGNRLKVAVTKT